MIPKISAEDLKKMQDREGLVLQGCGGDLQEWEDGIHQMLTLRSKGGVTQYFRFDIM